MIITANVYKIFWFKNRCGILILIIKQKNIDINIVFLSSKYNKILEFNVI